MHKARRYVDVIARWHDDGRITPLCVCWADGRTFQVGRVIGADRLGKHGRPGDPRTLRYVVDLEGRRKQLFLERCDGKDPKGRWYVEIEDSGKPWKFGTSLLA